MDPIGGSTRIVRRLAALVLILCAAVAVAACGGDDDSGEGAWARPNGDLSNHRQADSEIDAGNVDDLAVAWTRDLTAGGSYGFFASTPLIDDGTVYLHDLASNVVAVDLESGETKWTREYDDAVIGPNGVTLDDGTLYGVTSSTVFALDASDGSERWNREVQVEGDLSLTIAPQVHDGRVFASTITRPGGGIIFALDAETGEQLWTFTTLEDPSSVPEGRAAGGAWYTPLVDPDGGVYFGIGNAYITAREGLEDPDAMLYTNSVVKLDPETGELVWHYQGVPNDFYDWDMQISPVHVDDAEQPMVLGAGKMGYVYAMSPDDGGLIWKRSVGLHNGRDDDPVQALEDPGSVTLDPPVEIAPGPYGGVETSMAYQDGVAYAAIVNLPGTLSDLDVNYGAESGTFDFEGNRGEVVAIDVNTGEILWQTDLPTMALGAATIANDLVFTTTFDGTAYALSREDGSIVWEGELPGATNAPVAIAGDTLITAASYPQGRGQAAQIVAYRLGATGEPNRVTTPQTETVEPTPAVGRQVFSRSCASCHTLADAEAGGTSAPNLDQTMPSRQRVEEMVRFGGGGMPSFGATLSESQIDAVASYVAEAAGRGGDETPAP